MFQQSEELLTHPTADWLHLYDRNYRRLDVYSMAWDVDLNSSLVAGAAFGGPIAVTPDSGKILSATSVGGDGRPTIRIYSSSGRVLSTVHWSSSARIVAMGWTDSERLLVVSHDAAVHVYNIHGDLHSSFSLGAAVKEQGVLEVEVWGAGMAVLTKQFQFCAVPDVEDPVPVMLANTGLTKPPTSWAVIQPQFTGSGSVEVLVGTPTGSILVVDADRCSDQKLSNGPFTRMAVAPTGKILATFTATGQMWVVMTDFSENLSEFSSKSKVPPTQLAWCGQDSVVMSWDGILLMVGPYGDWIKYNYDEPIHLIPEFDGVRVISNSKCEFLQRVPNPTEDIFKIGSTASSAMLYDAMEHFQRKSPKADELIRMIKEADELSDAVDACIESASHEWVPRIQRSLLKAASFGKCFLSGHDADLFVSVCRALRVLNAVRAPEVGIPITYVQFGVLSADVLIDRLINRHQHFLAWKVCKFLKMKANRVLIHWACAKVKGAGDDLEISQAIVQRLQSVPGISYAEVASTAYKHGRPQLATRLLDYEPRAADQVPLLISMNQEETALNKAIECGDTDLVYLVILHIKRTKSPAEFFNIVRSKPQAVNLLIKYCWEQDTEMLKAVFEQTEQPERQGDIAVKKAYAIPDIEQRARFLSTAHEMYAKSRATSFQRDVTEDQVRLLRTQMDLETSLHGEAFVGLSVGQTLKKLLAMGHDSADKIMKKFKVPETRYWWLKIRALSERGRWDHLAQFAASKKSPIGYGPFVECCIEQGNFAEGVQYVKRIPETHVQAAFYLRLERYREAADCADKLEDPGALQQILMKCKTVEDKNYVENLLRPYR